MRKTKSKRTSERNRTSNATVRRRDKRQYIRDEQK